MSSSGNITQMSIHVQFYNYLIFSGVAAVYLTFQLIETFPGEISLKKKDTPRDIMCVR